MPDGPETEVSVELDDLADLAHGAAPPRGRGAHRSARTARGSSR